MQNLQNEKQKIIAVSAMCHGLKGRDRKVKFHSWQLPDADPNDFSITAIIEHAKDVLSKNCRNIKNPRVLLYEGEIDSHGIKTVKIMPPLDTFNLGEL
jgi:hypothetical protein